MCSFDARNRGSTRLPFEEKSERAWRDGKEQPGALFARGTRTMRQCSSDARSWKSKGPPRLARLARPAYLARLTFYVPHPSPFTLPQSCGLRAISVYTTMCLRGTFRRPLPTSRNMASRSRRRQLSLEIPMGWTGTMQSTRRTNPVANASDSR
jgi:hypothetical protein